MAYFIFTSAVLWLDDFLPSPPIVKSTFYQFLRAFRKKKEKETKQNKQNKTKHKCLHSLFP